MDVSAKFSNVVSNDDGVRGTLDSIELTSPGLLDVRGSSFTAYTHTGKRITKLDFKFDEVGTDGKYHYLYEPKDGIREVTKIGVNPKSSAGKAPGALANNRYHSCYGFKDGNGVAFIKAARG